MKSQREKISFHTVKQTKPYSTIPSKQENVYSVFLNFKKIVNRQLSEKHQTDAGSYNVRIINDIIYNEKAHIVAKFKDFLIFDDTSEFMRRHFKINESKQRLRKVLDFYDTYSKIFANYIILPEAKYMYKNIQRKQKMIDGQQRTYNEEKLPKETDKIFNTEIYNSIMNQTENLPLIEENSNMSLELLIDTINKNDKEKDDPITSKNKEKEIKDLNFNTICSHVNLTVSEKEEKNKNVVTTTSINNVNTTTTSKSKVKNEIKKTINTNNVLSSVNINVNTQNLNNFFSTNTINSARGANKKNIKTPITNSNLLNPASNGFNKRTTKETIRGERMNSPIEPGASPNKNIKATINPTNNNIYKSITPTQPMSPNHQSPTNPQITKKATFVSHKGTLSMPKLATNNIYNNFNIINNYQTTAPQTTQINIFNNVDGGVLNNLLTNNINIKNNIGLINEITNSLATMQNNNMNNSITKHLSGTTTTPKEQSPKKSSSQVKNGNEKSASKDKQSNNTNVNPVNRNETLKMIKGYTSDLSKLKQTGDLTSRLAQNKAKLVLSTNKETTGSITSRITSPVNNTKEIIKQTPLIQKSRLKESYNANTLRSILHRDLFENENNGLTDRIVSKKIENPKVNILFNI